MTTESGDQLVVALVPRAIEIDNRLGAMRLVVLRLEMIPSASNQAHDGIAAGLSGRGV